MSFWLEFEQDGEKQQYTFDAVTVSVGRDQAADFVLDHPTVSRQHAVFRQNPNGFRLVVLSQSGLTAVDGNQVYGEVDIYDGSLLHFGQFNFVFRSQVAQQPSSPFGQQPGGFGQQPAPGGFGQPAPGGFGQQPAPGGFGQTPAGGFGQQPAPGGFGQTPAGGFGQQPPASGGFGQTPAGGFGQQSAPGGFGQPAPGGFGQPAPGGFGQPGAAPPKPKGEGIVTWDEIAATADDMEDEGGATARDLATDFQRIQAAAEKGKKSEGPNPVLLGGVAIVVIGMVAWLMLDDDKKVIKKSGPEGPEVAIKRQPGEVDCLGKAECMQKAELNYTVGLAVMDKVEVDIANRFEAYNRFDLAGEYLEKAGIEGKPPKKFADLDKLKEQTRDDLDKVFRGKKLDYHRHGQRKMYSEMVDVINEVMALYPHKGSKEYVWALTRERELKDRGTYPKKF